MTRALLGALATAAVVAGCGDKPAPPSGTAQKDPFAITAGPALAARLKIGEAREAEVRETLRVPGRVEVDETRVARVGSPVTGRVSGLVVREGDDVKRGQTLATLTSTELSNTQLEYLKAYSQKLVAERAAGRAQQLLEADVIGAAELQRRQAEAVQADAELNAARDRLKVLGMSERAIAQLAAQRRVDSTSHIVSSIAGTVIDRKVSPGQVVQPADTVFVVADLSEVWIVADVPEAIAGSVRAGQTVEVEIPAIPDRRIRGALSFVGVVLNPETRTVRVRMDVPNQEREYKPAMLATVLIQGPPQKRRVVPSTAIVRDENRDYVFVQTAPDAFVLRQVTLAEEYDGVRVLAAGLRPDDKIVVDGAFHLNNERRQRALQSGGLGSVIDGLVRAALKQRLIVVVIALALLAFGLQAARKLSVDAFPDVTNVQVQIATEAPGRSPEEVERFVTVPLEISMTGLPGLTELRSLNKPGLSLITLVFTDATNVYFARQLVMERLLEVGANLPQGVTPVLGPVSTALGEVYQYTLERPDDGKRALAKDELLERRTVQDWVVRPLLRSIPGVAEINSTGGYVKQYQVLVDPNRLRYFKVSIGDVYQALARNNANSGGGVLPQGAEAFLVRGVGLIRDLDDIRSIVLKEIGATPVYIRDVAEVTIGEEVRAGAMIKDGYTEAAGGIVMMIRAGNAKEVVGRVKARVQEINDRSMLPGGLKIVPYYDRSELVDEALWTVTKVLLEGVLLVVVVLFLFLGDVRSSIIVVATLVLTPLLTFIVMNRYGLSANLMSLGGLAIAIGLMVDGSVVVIEHAFAKLGEHPGESRARVILEAVLEVATPVIFGVGIIILVFLPLMTLQGMEGKMFAPLAYTIAIALAISLVISLTLSPALASYLLKGGAEHETWLIRTIKTPYLRLLDRALANEKTTIGAAVALFVATLAVFPFLGTAFIPEMKEGSISPAMDRVPNISLAESIALEMEAMRLVLEVPGVKSVVSRIGRGESPADPAGPNEADPIVSLKPRGEWPDGWTQDDIAEAIREKLKLIPGVQLVMAQPISDRVDEMVTGVRADIAVKIFGDDLATLKAKADEIARIAAGVRGVGDFRVDRITGQQYLTIAIDRAAIARVGLNAADIHDAIETAIGGKRATEIYEGERRFAAVVRLPEALRDSVAEIRRITITSPRGAIVPLESLAKIEVVDGPAQISRETAKRRIVVGINVKGRDLGGFVAELQQKVDAQVKLPEGYYLDWGGQFENLQRALGHLMIIVPVTIAAIFFLLFLLFNSLRFATLIITVLPFSSIGGILALAVTGEYLSVPASVGFIALWGIAVLNGVVLVSYIRTLRDEGLGTREAVVEGARLRFRPVMMTATVALLALIPFLFATGPGSEVQRPLAIVVIGGLITSTLLTLVVVPTLYRFFEEKRIEA